MALVADHQVVGRQVSVDQVLGGSVGSLEFMGRMGTGTGLDDRSADRVVPAPCAERGHRPFVVTAGQAKIIDG